MWPKAAQMDKRTAMKILTKDVACWRLKHDLKRNEETGSIFESSSFPIEIDNEVHIKGPY